MIRRKAYLVTDELGQKHTILCEESSLLEDFSIKHGVTFRKGGFGKEEFKSFNLASYLRDEAVYENRKLLSQILEVKAEQFTFANQVHGIRCVEVTEDNIGAGWNDPDRAIPSCDALFTREKGVPLFICVADCVPVLLYDRKEEALAVIHAGWRGVYGKLPTIVLETMQKAYGTEPKNCYAYLGPAIGAANFEVDLGLAKAFQNNFPQAGAVHYEAPREKGFVDLRKILKSSLAEVGLRTACIDSSETDTFTEELCFSYRREQGKTGRMALFAMLT